MANRYMPGMEKEPDYRARRESSHSFWIVMIVLMQTEYSERVSWGREVLFSLTSRLLGIMPQLPVTKAFMTWPKTGENHKKDKEKEKRVCFKEGDKGFLAMAASITLLVILTHLISISVSCLRICRDRGCSDYSCQWFLIDGLMLMLMLMPGPVS